MAWIINETHRRLSGDVDHYTWETDCGKVDLWLSPLPNGKGRRVVHIGCEAARKLIAKHEPALKWALLAKV